MKLLIFFLNLPHSLTSVIPLILSIPYSFRIVTNPLALVFRVKSFWWFNAIMKHARAMTIGHIILLGPKELKNDFEHELIHVKQCEKYPFIFPFLYGYEAMTKE